MSYNANFFFLPEGQKPDLAEVISVRYNSSRECSIFFFWFETTSVHCIFRYLNSYGMQLP